ncbi:DUF1217 domain-containing protein [Pseudooceanicola onchidii]|uniref:DUF1217 domain-containing protein n=1 Tax=Pseudooceanicola onchidii TaxID=2562279 RepID=UPI0010AB309F|nr:DUF1217 domain-containing protein [Pseudooceanicola onchidii]
MTYQPILAGSGIVGWNILNKTMDVQRKTFDASPQIVRDTDYFEAKIGEIKSAEELVSDRRLLRVALGAFGLGDDINNKAFIQRVLEGGTIDDDALANRLTDSRYKAFAKAFGFGDFDTPSTVLSDFGPKITEKFRRHSFEIAVGEQDDSLRLALNAEREIVDLAARKVSNTTKWLQIMGTPALRQVFEGALGMPSSFGQLDIDQQLEIFQDRADRQLGTAEVSELADPEMMTKLVQRFLLRSQVSEFQTASSGSIAISMLQGAVSLAKSFRAG